MTQNLGSTSNPLSMTGEQWVLEERTDDPLSPDPGECWIRTDLNAGDKIATLKFGDGSEVPIFPTGTSEPGVLEVRRVQTGGQTGYLPVAEPDESRFPQFRLQHNNTVYSLHDDIEPGVIPDSEDLHARYDYSVEDGTIPVDDQTGNGYGLGSGSYSGVSGDINGNQAGYFDGVDDTVYTTFTEISQPTHTFAVLKLRTVDTDNGQTILDGADGARNELSQPAINEWRMFAGNSLNLGTADTSPHVFSMLFDGANSTLRIDGVEIGTGDAGVQGLGGVRMGANIVDDIFAPVTIGEVLYYPQDKSSVQTDVESYLSDKWGITI